jgi:hypothetical protein
MIAADERKGEGTSMTGLRARPGGTRQFGDRVGLASAATRTTRARAILGAALFSIAMGAAIAGASGAPGDSRPSRPAAHVVSANTGLWRLPVPARGPVSAALGLGDSAYALVQSPDGFRGQNPAQRLDERFTRSGASVSSAGLRLQMRLRAVGYGPTMTPIEPVTPVAQANGATYVHAAVTEWYRNGPLGLEQGFTIPRSPDGRPGGPLVLAVAMSGNARSSSSADRRSLTMSYAGAPSLRYSGLLSTDASGRGFRSWLQPRGREVLLHVDTRGARYPLRIDPLIQQGSKLTGEGEAGKALFGSSVALSADGNTALVGAPADDTPGSDGGAAWVFTRSGELWSQQGSRLSDGEKPSELGFCPPYCGTGFGTSVALSEDGNTALIGAPRFLRTTEIEGEIVGEGSNIIKGLSSTAGLAPGDSVHVVSGPAVTVVQRVVSETEIEVLSPFFGPAFKAKLLFTLSAGAVWVFARSHGVWTKQGTPVTSTEAVGGGFGSSLALSADGNTALIGNPSDSLYAAVGLFSLGAAWVFTRSDEGTWTQQGPKITGFGDGLLAERFGGSLALSADGNTALIGAPVDHTAVDGEGEVTEGSQIVKGLVSTAGIASGDLVSGAGLDGRNTRVSKVINEQEVELSKPFGGTGGKSFKEKLAFVTGLGEGAVWAYTRSAGVWSQSGKPFRGTGGICGGGCEIGGGEFGETVALSGDGLTALIGSPGDNSGIGAAWAFTRSGETWTQQGPKLTGREENIHGAGGFGSSFALSFDGSTALVGDGSDSSGTGAVWDFARSSGVWSQQGPKLTGGGELGNGGFGANLALSADGNTALIGGPSDNSGIGAAWVFAPQPPAPVVSPGSPADGVLSSQATPTFTWSASDEGGPGIAHIDFLLDGAQAGGDLPPSATSFRPGAPLADGSYTWQVRVVDKLGFTTTTPARTITIDTAPPSAPTLVGPDAGGWVYQAVPIFTWAASSDPTSGISGYELLIDGIRAATVSPGACNPSTCAAASPLALGNGLHSWQVLAVDGAGNIAASPIQSFTVAVGPPPPRGPVGVSINHGDYATNTPRVILDIVWPRGANQVLLSNDGGFNLPGQTTLLPVAPEIPWTLRSAGSERLPKTVYMRFPESATPTSTYTDDIILDTTTPVIRSANIVGTASSTASVASNHGHAYRYRIRLRAHEVVSGISAAQISDTRGGGTTTRFKSPKERGILHLSRVVDVNQTQRPHYVRVQSAAGTWSSWRKLH